MIDIENQTNLDFDLAPLEQIAKSVTDADIELLVVDNETIQALNAQHRGKETPTDVLSFPLEYSFAPEIIGSIPLGSIVIAAPYVIEKAKAFEHTTQEELTLLFIHGLLHLLGFDHEVDQGEMRAKEKELIERFGLPESLIVRTTTPNKD